MTVPTKPAFYADFSGLATLKGAAKNQDPQALREAARQFESLFTQMMLKSMRQATASLPGGGLMDNEQSDMYREMADNQLALQLSKGRGLGLADMLVRQLSQAGGKDKVEGAKGADKGPASKDSLPAQPLPEKTTSNETTSTAKASADKLAIGPRAHESEGAHLKIDATKKDTRLRIPATRLPVLPNALKAGGASKVDAIGVAPTTSNWTPSATNPVWSAMPAWQSALPAVEATPENKPAQDSSPPGAETVVQPAAKKDEPPAEPVKSASPQPLARSAADFVRQLWPHAQKAARELGVDAKTLIAHAALETGWGKFVPCNPDGTCSFNLFGIKAAGKWTGPSTAVNTLEFEDGVAVKKQASFRAYDSPADSFRDYASFIKNSPRYAGAVGAGGDAVAFASALQQGGYATDPNYATKLASVASRLDALYAPGSATLKLADNQPLSTGRSVSAGGDT